MIRPLVAEPRAADRLLGGWPPSGRIRCFYLLLNSNVISCLTVALAIIFRNIDAFKTMVPHIEIKKDWNHMGVWQGVATGHESLKYCEDLQSPTFLCPLGSHP
jgi:hypothetical protein